MGILSSIWAIILKFSTLPTLIYFIPEKLLHNFLGFLFFSSDHGIIHNIVLIVVWLSIYGALYMLFIEFVTDQWEDQCMEAEVDYDVPLFNFWIIVLYSMTIIFPLMVRSDWFWFADWAIYFTICFPLVVWIYYLFNAGLGIFVLFLRQAYCIFLFLILITVLLLPSIIGFIIALLNGSVTDYFDGVSVTRPHSKTITTTTYEDGTTSTHTDNHYY